MEYVKERLTDSSIQEFIERGVSLHVDDLRRIDAIQSSIEYDLSLQAELNESIDLSERRCEQFEREHIAEPVAVMEAKKAYRKEIEQWYSQSFFMDRATKKPSGYPGDFKTIEAVYDGICLSDGIGEYLDHNFFSAALAKAIVNRKDWMANWLLSRLGGRTGDLRMLNVASGSCREWFEVMQKKPRLEGVELTCLDQDGDSLSYSKERMESFSSGLKITPVKDNVLKIALAKKERNIEKYGQFDVVYSIGLYDYLPDNVLSRLISSQNALLKDNGRSIFAFKDRERYNPTRYDWTCDWKFVPRNPQGIEKLLREAGADTSAMDVSREPSGVIIFYETKKF